VKIKSRLEDAVRAAARERDVASDPRWDAFAAGTATPEEMAELRKLAEVSPAAREALIAFRPLDEKQLDQFANGVVRAIEVLSESGSHHLAKAILQAEGEEGKEERRNSNKLPRLVRKVHKVLTLGIKDVGKSSLTQAWASPLLDHGNTRDVNIERYECIGLRVQNANMFIEHVFELHEWSGEHIVDAQQGLAMEGFHGVLIVVDLGGRDAKQIDMTRIEAQLCEFNGVALRSLFTPKVVATCKSVVLFINKSDLLATASAQAEGQATALYQPLIAELMTYGNQFDVKIFVGSARYGHSIHKLRPAFTEQVLPRGGDEEIEKASARRRDAPFLSTVLTPRECVIARLLVETGLSSKEIGSHLCIGEGTLRKHIQNIYRKMNVHSRVEFFEVMKQVGAGARVPEGPQRVRERAP